MIMGKRGSVALGRVAWQDVSAAQASSATACRRLEGFMVAVSERVAA
ncbi:hypothetical protein [Dyella sp.]|nr:hypothetical protein [Dyella sp.]MDR3446582.1 hypothetical protein [Dyella sp.]